MSHVETRIGYTDGRHDRCSSELAYSRTYASHTRGSNEADSAFLLPHRAGILAIGIQYQLLACAAHVEIQAHPRNFMGVLLALKLPAIISDLAT